MKITIPLLAVAALASCDASQAPGNLEDDMLPSAEVTAFQRLDRRLGYEDARIGYDDDGCAVYRATGPDGRPYAEGLRDGSARPICVE